jgi:hypothetical protein
MKRSCKLRLARARNDGLDWRITSIEALCEGHGGYGCKLLLARRSSFTHIKCTENQFITKDIEGTHFIVAFQLSTLIISIILTPVYNAINKEKKKEPIFRQAD